MSRLLYAFTLALILPISAQATSTASIINTSCSGSLTSSLIDGASFACAGNLTLDGGFITSDSVINISADGDLFLDNLTLTAPNISLSVQTGAMIIGSNMFINADSNVTVSNLFMIKDETPAIKEDSGGNVIIFSDAGNLDLTAGTLPSRKFYTVDLVGSIELRPVSGFININFDPSAPSQIVLTPVPEPSTYLMVLLGIGFITYRRQFKH